MTWWPRRRLWHHIAVVATVVLAAVVGTALEWRQTAPGFPLDDSWIHLQFARNVAEGHGFSFNPGVSSSGSSAPLWSLLLAVPLLAGLGPLASAKLLGVALVAVTASRRRAHSPVVRRRLCGAAGRPGRGRHPADGLGRAVGHGGAALHVAGHSGDAGVRSRARQSTGRQGALGAVGGLAGWARPEAFVAAGILGAAWLTEGARDRTSRRFLPGWWHPLALLGVLTLGFVAFNEWTGGRPLPNTFYAKNYGMGTAVSLAEGRPLDALIDAGRYPLNLLGDAIRWQASHDGLLFGAALAGVLALAGAWAQPAPRGGRALLAVLLLTPMAKGLVAPQPVMLVHDGRYVLHLLVLGLVVCACGVAVLARYARPRWVLVVLSVAGLVQIGGATVSALDTYASEVKNINDLQVRTAHWIDEHTAPDARIATNDIGAIAFFSRRFILDTEGLVTPDAIWDKRMWRIDRFLERSRPDLVVIFPHWYPVPRAPARPVAGGHPISAPVVVAGGPAL